MKKYQRTITLYALLIISGMQLLVAQSSQKREVSAFSEISLRISANVHLQQGSAQSVEVKGKEDAIGKLLTEVKERKLVIRFANSTWLNKWNPGPIDIYITVPQIDGLAVSGSGSVVSKGQITTRILDLAISGSGDINLDGLTAEKVTATLSGSGSIYLAGKQDCVDLKAIISGSGDVRAIDLPVDNADIKISGSGNCWVNPVKKLYVRLVGSGNVVYRGKPSIDSGIAGSGKVEEE